MVTALDSDNCEYVVYIEDMEAEFAPRHLVVLTTPDRDTAIKTKRNYERQGMTAFVIATFGEEGE